METASMSPVRVECQYGQPFGLAAAMLHKHCARFGMPLPPDAEDVCADVIAEALASDTGEPAPKAFGAALRKVMNNRQPVRLKQLDGRQPVAVYGLDDELDAQLTRRLLSELTVIERDDEDPTRVWRYLEILRSESPTLWEHALAIVSGADGYVSRKTRIVRCQQLRETLAMMLLDWVAQ